MASAPLPRSWQSRGAHTILKAQTLEGQPAIHIAGGRLRCEVKCIGERELRRAPPLRRWHCCTARSRAGIALSADTGTAATGSTAAMPREPGLEAGYDRADMAKA